MKLTVASTSPMNPVFLMSTDSNHSHTIQPASVRAFGLLEFSPNPGGTNEQQVVTHDRPNVDSKPIANLNLDQFICLQEQYENRLVVFGFHHDGTDTWYRVRNNVNQQLVWVQHTANITYLPYSALTMDKLISLTPQWNGILYSNPSHKHHASNALKEFINVHGKTDVNLYVSDSVVNDKGDLWFLMTAIYSESAPSKKIPHDGLTPYTYQHLAHTGMASGWIAA